MMNILFQIEIVILKMIQVFPFFNIFKKFEDLKLILKNLNQDIKFAFEGNALFSQEGIFKA